MLKENQWALIRYKDKRYLKKLTPEGSINVRKEILKFSEVIGKPPGVKVGSFQVFEPTLEEIIVLGFKRKTQIIYPKDSFYISLKLNVGRGRRMLEFGTGSGAMCAVFSHLGAEVHTHEAVEEFHKLAQKNLREFGLDEGVNFHLGDFMDQEVEEGSFDAAFVDVKDPIPYLNKVYLSLKDGAPVGFLLPTTNQVSALISEARDKFGGFEVMEILVRYYKPNPERLRPEDTMVGHTAYLVFCRKLIS